MPRTRDDIDKAQREEQADHERALESVTSQSCASKPGESSEPPKEKKDDASD
jgi:hypothetical protein